MPQIRYLTPQDTTRWDDYIQGSSSATCYHLTGWKRVIEETFGHRSFYLMALDGEKIVGVLPLVLMKSLVFGRFLVSLPFFNYGGVVADDASIEGALMQEAIQVAERERVYHVEFRHWERKELGLQAKEHKVSMMLELPGSSEELWKTFKSKLRSQIRKPQKEGLTARIGGSEELDHFYRVFTANMRDLGTPVYPKRFFAGIWREFPEKARICSVFLESKPLAAGLLVSFQGQMEIPWASSLRNYNHLSPIILLYWTALSYACDSGHRRFDFGRSTSDEGTYLFKEQWGARPLQLYWQYWLRDGRPLPELNPHNPKYHLAIQVWRRAASGADPAAGILHHQTDTRLRMCGIVGKYNFHGQEPVSPELIKAMCDKIIYRGPDDYGVYTDGHVGLGHRRLSILDLSALGHQPMASRDETLWITYNGEIYNFQTLRKDLTSKGYSFVSNCDTEVIIYLYQEYGENCLKHLRGMFAFGQDTT